MAVEIHKLGVPSAVRAGENVVLECLYDMQGEALYSVKWYRGRREFYRYRPKETPANKVFSFPGLNVDVSIVLLLLLHQCRLPFLFLLNRPCSSCSHGEFA